MANYSVNYNDKRFTNVNNEKTQALNSANDMYNNMISSSDEYYNKQIQAAQDYTTTQKDLQQANTDFAIEQINQQKEQSKKDYLKEQKGAYVDWQQQSNQYGVNAENMATQGLNTSGYSESSQVSMYNTYQNRLSSAREVYDKAILNYDNGIKEAQLQNNAKLAEIAYQGLQTELELGLQGFQYKNSLLEKQLETTQTIENNYYQRWKDVLSQINTENALNEQARQYDLDMKYKQQQLAEQKRQANLDYSIKQQQLAEQKRQYNTSLANSSVSSSDPYKATTSIKLDTNYYKGNMTKEQVQSINKYGAFAGTTDKNSIPYQPRGIILNGYDYGKVEEIGKTASQFTGNNNITNSSGVKIGNQKVWKTSDGKYWVWNGSKMQYETIKGIPTGSTKSFAKNSSNSVRGTSSNMGINKVNGALMG